MKLIISGRELSRPVIIEQEEGQDFNLADGPVIDSEQARSILDAWWSKYPSARAYSENSNGDFVLAGANSAFDKDANDTSVIIKEWASDDGFWLTDWPFADLVLGVQVEE